MVQMKKFYYFYYTGVVSLYEQESSDNTLGLF